MTRRAFLGVCAVASTGAVLGSMPATLDPSRDPRFAHTWSMAMDIDRCIGCGRCVAACRAENDVPVTRYRTWIERYVIMDDGRVLVDSPNGGEFGFPEIAEPELVRRAFHVPKMCNHCDASACTQVCPVGATFDAPDGVTLVDPLYCVGCSYCVQACPYGCRFVNPETEVADKCTLCYHRIDRGLRPACVEACPTGTRIFGDMRELEGDIAEAKYPDYVEFMRSRGVQVLKPHLGTRPKVFYSNLDQEVR
ncbi:MAG: 4Fe-4S dicluster domain-containing protein [Acidobacteriota bacterium]|nr:MAG: 4Fe-4S dicluster domain-containing protein [Acidobacteriota bacterium]